MQQIYINGKCNFLVESRILNGANKAHFREKLPLGNLDPKELATSENSFTKAVVSQLLKFANANLRHAITHKVIGTTCSFSKFIEVSLSKVKVK
jgi:hypothetical protein